MTRYMVGKMERERENAWTSGRHVVYFLIVTYLVNMYFETLFLIHFTRYEYHSVRHTQKM